MVVAGLPLRLGLLQLLQLLLGLLVHAVQAPRLGREEDAVVQRLLLLLALRAGRVTTPLAPNLQPPPPLRAPAPQWDERQIEGRGEDLVLAVFACSIPTVGLVGFLRGEILGGQAAGVIASGEQRGDAWVWARGVCGGLPRPAGPWVIGEG